MPRVSNIDILHLREQPALVIRTRSKMEDLPKVIGQSYHDILRYLNQLGEIMADVPFVAYHTMDMQNLDIEIGIPIAKILPKNGSIKLSAVPEGKAAYCMYRGPYSQCVCVYREMAKWIADRGYQFSGASYEFYFNGPDTPEDELLTKILIPIKSV